MTQPPPDRSEPPAAPAPDGSDGFAPLSIVQAGAVAGALQAPDAAVMTICIDALVRPCLDVDLFVEACGRTAAELDGMRVQLVRRGGEWVQHVDDTVPARVVVHDLSGEEDPAAAGAALVERLSRTALPLDAGVPLVEQHLVVLGPQACHWLVLAHHAIADGYSGMLLRHRIIRWYDHLRGQAPEPEPVTASTVDAWPLADRGRDEQTVQRWTEYLGALPDRVGLSSREGDLAAGTTRTRVVVDADDVARLTAAGGLGSWAFPAFAVGVAYTARALAREDVVFGFVVAGRSHRIERETVSSSARVLPLRVAVAPGATLAELARQVRAAATGLKRLGPTTAEELRGQVPAAWRIGRVHGPILNVIPFDTELEMAGHEIVSQAYNRGPVEDLQVTIIPRGEGIEVDAVSNDHAYDPGLGPRHVQRLARLFHLVAERPDAPLLDLDPSLPDEAAARAAHEQAHGVRLLDEAGRPALVGEVAVVADPSGADTGRRCCLHPDGSVEDLGTAQDVAVVGGHVVALARVRRVVEQLPGVASCEVVAAKRRVQVRVRPTDGADPAAVERAVADRAHAVLPALAGPRVVVDAG